MTINISKLTKIASLLNSPVEGEAASALRKTVEILSANNLDISEILILGVKAKTGVNTTNHQPSNPFDDSAYGAFWRGVKNADERANNAHSNPNGFWGGLNKEEAVKTAPQQEKRTETAEIVPETPFDCEINIIAETKTKKGGLWLVLNITEDRMSHNVNYPSVYAFGSVADKIIEYKNKSENKNVIYARVCLGRQNKNYPPQILSVYFS